MSQIIKLDGDLLNNVVKGVIDEVISENDMSKLPPDAEESNVKLTLGMDNDGKYYIIKDAYTDNPQIVYQEK
jgi:hypothetical protein